MLVKDFMVKEVKALSPDMTVRDAIKLLLSMRITGLPVIDESKKLVGMLSEKEFLKSGLPSYYDQVHNLAYLPAFKPFEDKLLKSLDMKVSDIMRTKIITVNEDMPIVEAARLMVTKHSRRLVVLREDKIVGIIARSDIVKAVLTKAGMI